MGAATRTREKCLEATGVGVGVGVGVRGFAEEGLAGH